MWLVLKLAIASVCLSTLLLFTDAFTRAGYGYGIITKARPSFRLNSETTVTNSEENAVTKKKQYIPRSATTPAPVSPTSLAGQGVSTSSSSSSSPTTTPAAKAPRIYKPKMSNSKFSQLDNTRRRPNNYSSNNSNNSSNNKWQNKRGDALLLNEPQLLIRYRVPRVKSDFKIQLEAFQEKFVEEYSSTSNNYGYSDNRRDSSDPFVASFNQPVSSSGFKGGNQRRGPEGRNQGRPSAENDRGRRNRKKFDDDEDMMTDYSEYSSSGVDYSDFDGGEEEEDYYGDEQQVSLSSIGSGVLQSMVRDKYSFEDMQIALYSEYGVKASVSAIRRRLQDDQRNFRKRTGKTRREKRKARDARKAGPVDNSINLEEYESGIQLQELAGKLDIGAGELVKYLMMNMGMMATMTQTLDLDTSKKVIVAFGKEVAGEEEEEEEEDDDDDDDDDNDGIEATSDEIIPTKNEYEDLPDDELIARAPIVTIMGHVDHGKTTLLDSIRSARVANSEAGGITQGVSAFKVETKTDSKFITFFDTPGHAAFSEMRKRGAGVTDIVILVVAADDGIMEQTKECIAAAKAARCPIIVAINKIDKEGADVDRVKTDLMSHGIVLEDFGGDSQGMEISAKNNVGIDALLDKVSLQAEIMNLRVPVTTNVEGSVIEAKVDKGLGVVVTGLVQKGTLHIGDLLLAGPSYGRVRRIISDSGEDLEEAGPSTPVQIVGLSNVPSAGDVFTLSCRSLVG